jgi:hypothetical protein
VDGISGIEAMPGDFSLVLGCISAALAYDRRVELGALITLYDRPLTIVIGD